MVLSELLDKISNNSLVTELAVCIFFFFLQSFVGNYLINRRQRTIGHSNLVSTGVHQESNFASLFFKIFITEIKGVFRILTSI